MDIILTGIARSGTTLTCSLLNMLPQCVALHEPMNPSGLVGIPFPYGYLERISAFYTAQRHSLLGSGRAVSKARGGSIPDNPFDSSIVNDRLRPSTVQNQEVVFGKNLKEGFRLVVKHPNFFTATLSVLKDVYPCYAIIRNPLAVLLSKLHYVYYVPYQKNTHHHFRRNRHPHSRQSSPCTLESLRRTMNP